MARQHSQNQFDLVKGSDQILLRPDFVETDRDFDSFVRRALLLLIQVPDITMYSFD